MGYSADQIIHDCLDHYERHLEFLRPGAFASRRGVSGSTVLP
jgi:hypothetical protein